MAAPIRLAISCGDPAGIGPEIALRAISYPGTEDALRVLLVGPPTVWDRAAKIVGAPLAELHHAEIVPAGPDSAPAFGRGTAATGRIALDALAAATDAVVAGRADALVTAPLSKEAIAAAGSPFKGHTDWLEARFGGTRGVMAFVGGGLRVALVTIHIPLSEVPRRVTAAAVTETCRIFAAGLRERFGLARPRLAVCGINPHAGEGGLLGPEDEAQVRPGVAAARAAGVDATGPLPGDTAFTRALSGEFDAVVACYHDQGLAPVKARAMHEAVNVTLGLPIVRTSPAHGTAFDLAGTGRADPHSMGAALRLAAQLATSVR